MTKLKPGPLQLQWFESLRKHPERQAKGRLGIKKENDDYKACCLGELGLIIGKKYWLYRTVWFLFFMGKRGRDSSLSFY